MALDLFDRKDPTLMDQRTFRRVGAALPKPLVDFFSNRLKCAGIRKDIRVWLGSRVLLSFFTGAIFLLLYLILLDPIATPESATIAVSLLVGGFVLVASVSYLMVYYQVADRSAEMERILPDFLLLTVSNLRAGMSPFAAFVHAARPEFGPFYEEVLFSTAKSGGKASLANALTEVSSYFDSHVLRRTVSLFAKGLRSGGHLAKLLNSIALEVRRIQDLRAELATSTRSYTIFLGFILVFVMPFLLSVSTHFVAVFLRINAESSVGSDISQSANLPVFSGKILVSVQDMVLISMVSLVSTSFFVSVLIGIISRGRATYGIKFFPVLALFSAAAYFLAKAFIESFLSGFAS